MAQWLEARRGVDSDELGHRDDVAGVRAEARVGSSTALARVSPALSSAATALSEKVYPSHRFTKYALVMKGCRSVHHNIELIESCQVVMCAWRQLALYRYLHPSVERAGAGPRSFSDEIFSRLFNQRIVCINGPISDDTASFVIAQLLFLQSESSHDPIRLRINSFGGTITAGLAIYDTVRYISSSTPISTLCIGQATSIGSLLLAAGTPGKRSALPHSRIMIHQPTGEPFNKATRIAMHAKEILKLRECVNKIYSYHTGQTIRQIEQCMDRDM
ncbi:ATP-dependent Clp protease proteolytic subunit-like [Zingiber officinale]|uniref:ATP-dependent Clp protease proteolytic subunit-like n=1 Tax=Zingiber officinale TaxID=94328 RepID=UPI001C4D5797|nr:ATP-dependent Clp protease proteolytic subunit-like [Zingiber officinale]